MKQINANWFIRYGWLTGKPNFGRRWIGGPDGKAIPQDYITISLCGTFWRAVRTTVIGLGIAALLTFIGSQAIFNTWKFLKAIGFIVACFIFWGSIFYGIDKYKSWRQANPKAPKVKNPSFIKDAVWAVKHKVCPVYEVRQ